MATLSFHHTGKIYPDGTEALRDICLDVADGEMMVVVGPPGAGKSSLLRVAAGLDDATDGQVLIEQQTVNRVPPAGRDIGMVFPDCELYPHMTVYQNLAYALKVRKLGRDQIRARIDTAARTLELTPCLDRRPHQLTDLQRRKVAIGRAAVRQPRLMLFDEPFSSMVAPLRAAMRLEIQRLHRCLNVTSLYATADPIEAMTLGQRMAVMNQGSIEQVGTPAEVFNRPATTFVATFIGSPPMNLLPCSVTADGQVVDDSGNALQVAPSLVPDSTRGRRVMLGVRPEHLTLHAPGLDVLVELVEMLGSEQLIHGMHGDSPVVIRCPAAHNRNYPIETGEAVQAGISMPDAAHWFDRDTGLRIGQ